MDHDGLDVEQEILTQIHEKGPRTGSELLQALGTDGLTLWRACKGSQRLILRTLGTHYLRLDRRVEGFARFSPSILREFLTYTVIGIPEEPAPVDARAKALLSHIEEVSKAKLDLAYQMVSGLSSRIESEWPLEEEACFIIAGDIVYNMSHDVPRPERSTGKLVRGSDMDMVVIVGDGCGEAFMKRLDEAIYQEKYRLLVTPHIKEEVDYVVKNLSRVQEQLRFDTFKHMVACKILQEGTFLFGSEILFQRVKQMLREAGVTERLAELERKARDFRNEAEAYLLREDPQKIREDKLYLFYPTEESEEFE